MVASALPLLHSTFLGSSARDSTLAVWVAVLRRAQVSLALWVTQLTRAGLATQHWQSEQRCSSSSCHCTCKASSTWTWFWGSSSSLLASWFQSFWVPGCYHKFWSCSFKTAEAKFETLLSHVPWQQGQGGGGGQHNQQLVLSPAVSVYSFWCCSKTTMPVQVIIMC